MKRFIYNIRSMQRALLFALLQLFALTAFAYDFESEGIYYNKLSDNTVQVAPVPTGAEKYSGDITIPDFVVIDDDLLLPVSGIGYGAFRDCTDLTSIVLPEGLTYINMQAFQGCTNLASINTSGVTSIGEQAFEDCRSLTSIVLPDGVTSIGSGAFYNCTSLASINIPSGVTRILGYTFGGCSSLTSLVLPDGVISIGIGAFSGCTSLASINIPSGVTSIDVKTFEDCSSLTSLVLPDDLIFIQGWAFSGCTSLASINIPSGVTWISDYTFQNCNRLTSLVFPDDLTGFGQSAFAGCTSLASINIPSGVTSIQEYTFYNCSSLTSLVLPDGVTSIGSNAFYGCTNLASINIPSGVTSIEHHTFERCSSLTSVVLPESVTSIGIAAFMNCFELSSVNIPSGVTSIGVSAFASCYALTSLVLPDGVTSIDNGAFNSCENLSSINIPAGVTSIADMTFIGCTSLTTIVIPEGVTSIGESAFDGCYLLADVTNMADVPQEIAGNVFSNYNATLHVKHGLHTTYKAAPVWQNFFKVIDDADGDPTVLPENFFYEGLYYNKLSETTVEVAQVPEGVEKYHGDIVVPERVVWEGIEADVVGIRMYAFWQCSDLTSVVLPESITYIGINAFQGCTNLASINIPSGVTSIEDEAFEDCSSLTSIVLPDGLTAIELEVFRGCSSLESINIPNGVTSIGSYAFYGCSSLTSLVLPESITSIANAAFFECTNLASINIPSGVTSIEEYTFADCSSLTSLVLPESITSIGEFAFRGCTNLASINIPSGVTSVEEFTFADCNSLTSLVLPDGVTTIGAGAFINCYALASINIPSGVTRIERYTFSECYSLTSLVIPDGVTYIGENAFYLCRSLASINIPSGVTSIEEYTFTECAITSVVLPDGITSIGDLAFYYCRDLESVNIPSSVTSIGERAFCGCSSLSSIILPEGVTSISSEAFMDCIALADVTNLADTPLEIPENVFTNYDATLHVKHGLHTTYKAAPVWQNFHLVIDDADGNPTLPDFFEYDGLYYHKLSETTVEVAPVPEGVEKYSGDIVIPETTHYYNHEFDVVGIAEGAFANSSQLVSISIPASVSSIDYNAFWGCDKLTDVTNLAATPQEITDKVFSTYGTLHVALGLRELYAAAPVWNMFNVIDGSEGVWFEQLYNGDAEKSWEELGLADVASDDMDNNYKVCAWGKENAGDPHPATIEEEDGGNHVFVVHGGDCVTEGEESNWDNQFWIESPQAWTSGTVMRVRFRYKASQNVTAQTQIHRQEPSDYIHWEAIGDVKFSTEWQQFDQIFTFTPDMDGGCSIAFNLNSEVKTATDFYFDDLSWQVQAPDGGYIKVGGIYYNVTTMTTVEVAPVAEGADPYMGTVVIPSRIRYNENKYDVVGIADGAFRNSETLYEVTIPNTVKHIGAEAFMGCNELGYIYNYSRVPQDIAEGTFSWYGILNVPYGTKDAYNAAPVWNQFNVIDDSERTWYELLFNGDAEKSWQELGLADVTYDDMENNYKLCAWGKENGTNTGEDGESLPHPAEIVALPEGGHAFIVRATDVELKVDGEEAWDNQFWIQSPYQWSEGTQLKLHFRYKASQNVGVVTQMHRQMPSDYLYWEAIGDVEFSTEWQDFDKILTITPDMDGAWAIAFNLNSEVKTATNFYFDDLSWSVLGPENGVFSSDGLYYNILSDNTVEVAPVPDGVEKYSGDIVIPETTHYYNHEFDVVGIGFNAFSSCIDLTSVSVPESVVSIEEGAFYNCSSLASVNIPAGVTAINNYAFYWCSSLTTLTLPEGLISIGERAFAGCSSLASINIPDGVTSIKDYTFYSCEGLTSLVLPDSVTSIGNRAFALCRNLASINIPTGVTAIGSHAFTECMTLEQLILPESLGFIGDYAFQHCVSLVDINIPSGISTIADRTFEDCKSLVELTLPESITNIGSYAFFSCVNLRSINIPSGVISIGENAFAESNSLVDVYNFADVPQQITEDVFTNYNATLHVKRGLKQTYAQAPVWQNFYTIKTDAEGAPDPEPFVEVDLDEPGTLEDEIWYPEIVEGLTITGPINGTDVNYIRTKLPELRFLNIEGAWVVEGGSAYYSTLSADSTGVDAPLYTSNYTIGDYMFSEMPRLHELMLCSNTKNIGKYIIAGSDNLFRIEIPQQVTNVADGALGGIKRVMVQWNADNAVVTDGVSDNPNLIIYATQNYKGNASRENLVIGDMAENIVLHEGNNLYIPQPFWAKQASYTRTFSKQTLRGTSAGWESIVLPFDVTNVVSEQKGRIAPFGSDEATDKHFYLARLGDNGFEMASELSANVPYIVSMPNSPEYAEQYNITGRVMFYAKSASGIYVSTTDEASESAGPAFTFVPTYERIQATPNFYVLNEEVYNGYMPGSVFLPNVEVEPFHPFVVDTSAHAPAYIPVFEGDVTAIMPILDMKPSRTDDAVYDLMGIRQDPNHLQKGKVYIVNGSKRVVKE